ncbi:MAG TPA: mercury(II) reductase, partial [bacterium]|nr:mercury(II) reductase [bacterium]
YPENSGEIQFNPDKISEQEIVDSINSIGSYRVAGKLKSSDSPAKPLDLIIIGGGSAAFAAAIRAAELEKSVLMINDGLPIGGTCVNVGCVPSKTLIRAAEQLYDANHPRFSGITVGAGGLDFKTLIRQKNQLVDDLRTSKYIDVLKDNPYVSIRQAHATLVDRNTVRAGDQTFTADHILMATGSTTYAPDIPWLAETDYLTNETLYQLDELPEHLIVLGGRYIALENAQMFARLGSKVTVLQRSLRILPDEMPDVTETLKELLEAEGIAIKTGVQFKSIRSKPNGIEIKAVVKDNEETISGSHLFVATGRKGNTVEMGIENIGVERYGKDFIRANEFLQTSVANIYAAGDVTGDHLFVYAAAYEGALAVDNMFGEKPVAKDYSVFPWVIFTDPQVAGVGMDENQAYQNQIDYEVSTVQLKDVPRSLAARNTRGFIKLLRNKADNKLIGARILASEGSELLMEISLAIRFGITVTELKKMFHPYLTLSEGVKIAAIAFDKDVKKLSCCAV